MSSSDSVIGMRYVTMFLVVPVIEVSSVAVFVLLSLFRFMFDPISQPERVGHSSAEPVCVEKAFITTDLDGHRRGRLRSATCLPPAEHSTISTFTSEHWLRVVLMHPHPHIV